LIDQRPVGSLGQAGDQLDTFGFRFGHNLISAAEIPDPLCGFDILPGEDLLEVAEDHQARPLQLERGCGLIPPQEALHPVG